MSLSVTLGQLHFSSEKLSVLYFLSLLTQFSPGRETYFCHPVVCKPTRDKELLGLSLKNLPCSSLGHRSQVLLQKYLNTLSSHFLFNGLQYFSDFLSSQASIGASVVKDVVGSSVVVGTVVVVVVVIPAQKMCIGIIKK